MIKILIADDHMMIIDGLRALLASEENISIVAQAQSGDEVMEFLERKRIDVDLIILDINMPGSDGIETAKLLKKKYPEVKILILTMYNKPAFIKNLIEAGVAGYILKNTGKNELLAAINNIQHGEQYFSQEVTKTVMNSFRNQVDNPEAQLTKRELEILGLLSKAHTTAEIAEQLFLSTYTIDTHRKNLLSKLNVKNTPALVKYAIEHGLTENRF